MSGASMMWRLVFTRRALGSTAEPIFSAPVQTRSAQTGTGFDLKKWVQQRRAQLVQNNLHITFRRERASAGGAQ